MEEDRAETAELPGCQGEQVVEKLLLLVVCADEGILAIEGTIRSPMQQGKGRGGEGRGREKYRQVSVEGFKKNKILTIYILFNYYTTHSLARSLSLSQDNKQWPRRARTHTHPHPPPPPPPPQYLVISSCWSSSIKCLESAFFSRANLTQPRARPTSVLRSPMLHTTLDRGKLHAQNTIHTSMHYIYIYIYISHYTINFKYRPHQLNRTY